ncbi:SDR family NAD(P)-dependent oxidoreductase [Megasphaera hominis]|jgi:NAD(P)-dependent dehydrogenase (short-subunit alcohol dehydrogenase family)|uniref:Glucose 1-dehydrogenase n=1 Tax=Megasphaera hominis TaxID=159836 RepID=A0ABR6VJE0_9FIRM|nr:glucose 1-dehydrogenase [Megasphaera hominis]MBC3536829.1 glucose 1-dehydrogenase [Megasphaera hominis]
MFDKLQLNGKTAIVTGGTKGIGKGIVEGLAQSGANVVVVSRHQDECDAVAKEIEKYGVKGLGVKTDVTVAAEVAQLMEKTIAAFGRIDILVNNAGSAITKKAEDLTEADWDRVIDMDMKSVFFVTQAAGKYMIQQKSGKIINLASMLGLVAEKQVLPYCVAKGGVLQMTKALALEWARYNIQVNAICPGYVITDINKDALSEEKVYKHITGKIPMRRFGEVGDIAGAAIFLASPASDYMTGQQIVLDGGWTMQ